MANVMETLTQRIQHIRTFAESLTDAARSLELFKGLAFASVDTIDGASSKQLEELIPKFEHSEALQQQCGYALIEDIVPAFSVSRVFQIVQAADAFKRSLKSLVGSKVDVQGTEHTLSDHDYTQLTRYGLSIGTPPVTTGMRELVETTLFGSTCSELATVASRTGLEDASLSKLLKLFETLVAGSLHYNNALEEKQFLAESMSFDNFGNTSLFHRGVVTESPERVVSLMTKYLFADCQNKGAHVRLVAEHDAIDSPLLAHMQDQPNTVFIARVTQLSNEMFKQDAWAQVLGRLIIVDDSPAARRSNTCLVFSLFPKVVNALRTIETNVGGRPANTQLQLRRCVEDFTPAALNSLTATIRKTRDAIDLGDVMAAQNTTALDYLCLSKMLQITELLRDIAEMEEVSLRTRGEQLRKRVTTLWMHYFYGDLSRASYDACVLTGGGRGALVMIGEHQRQRVARCVDIFKQTHLANCLSKLSSTNDAPYAKTLLDHIDAGTFTPVIILPELAWTYGDVFPPRFFPTEKVIRIALNMRYELDAAALRNELDAMRSSLEAFPGLFELVTDSMLLVINSPHNPTGVVYRKDTIRELLRVASDFSITLVDDNSYHKLIDGNTQQREGDACIAQLYEAERAQFAKPIRIITAGATTKGLQGSGDRTGLLHSNDADFIAFAVERAPAPHMLSLYMTKLKLEMGLAATKLATSVRALSRETTEPNAWKTGLSQLTQHELSSLAEETLPAPTTIALLRACTSTSLTKEEDADKLVTALQGLQLERALLGDIEQRLNQAKLAADRVASKLGKPLDIIEAQGAFYFCVRLSETADDQTIFDFIRAISRHRKVDVTYAGKGFVRLSLGGTLSGDAQGYEALGRVVEAYLATLFKYWNRYQSTAKLFAEDATVNGTTGESLLREEELPALLTELAQVI